jgi:hypothetical protein
MMSLVVSQKCNALSSCSKLLRKWYNCGLVNIFIKNGHSRPMLLLLLSVGITMSFVKVRVCAFPSYAPEGISPDCSPVEGRASIRQLFNWALEPAEDEILDELFLLGYQDALVWVNQQQTILSPHSNGAATQTGRPPPPLENLSQTSSI